MKNKQFTVSREAVRRAIKEEKDTIIRQTDVFYCEVFTKVIKFNIVNTKGIGYV